MKRIILITTVILLAAAACTNAAIPPAKDFYSNGTIQAGETWGDVHIYDTAPYHTTVSMTGGEVGTLYAYDSSIFTLSNGNCLGYGIKLHDLSHADISGGNISAISAYDSSTFTLSGGNVFYGAIGLSNFSHADISGSSGLVLTYDASTVNISGGKFDWVVLHDNSVANLYGGDISILRLANAADMYSVVNIYGNALEYNPTGGSYGEGSITGFWANSNSFTINLYGTDSSTSSRINLYVIPEPITFSFLVFGGLAIAGWRRKI